MLCCKECELPCCNALDMFVIRETHDFDVYRRAFLQIAG